MYDINQKQPNYTTKFLIESLAKVKLNQMSSEEVKTAINLAQLTGEADKEAK